MKEGLRFFHLAGANKRHGENIHHEKTSVSPCRPQNDITEKEKAGPPVKRWEAVRKSVSNRDGTRTPSYNDRRPHVRSGHTLWWSYPAPSPVRLRNKTAFPSSGLPRTGFHSERFSALPTAHDRSPLSNTAPCGFLPAPDPVLPPVRAFRSVYRHHPVSPAYRYPYGNHRH